MITIFFLIGASVLYLLFLAFALFQTRDDFRKILFFFDPKLKLAGPDTKVQDQIESYKMAGAVLLCMKFVQTGLSKVNCKIKLLGLSFLQSTASNTAQPLSHVEIDLNLAYRRGYILQEALRKTTTSA